MADIKWIKIYVDMFDHKKIKFIRNLPEGSDILLCWVMLLTSAGKCNTDGYIFLTSDIPYTAEMLADEYNMPPNTVRLALDTFRKLKMVNLDDNGIHVAGWEEYQNIDGMEKIRLQNRERAKRHYDKNKPLRKLEQSNVKPNVRITQPNETELELELDIEKEKTIKPKALKSSLDFSQLINEYTSHEELKIAIHDYLDHRKAMKKPFKSTRSFELFLQSLDKHTDKIGVLNQSVVNGWQGLFELKEAKEALPKFVYEGKKEGDLFGKKRNYGFNRTNG